MVRTQARAEMTQPTEERRVRYCLWTASTSTEATWGHRAGRGWPPC